VRVRRRRGDRRGHAPELALAAHRAAVREPRPAGGELGAGACLGAALRRAQDDVRRLLRAEQLLHRPGRAGARPPVRPDAPRGAHGAARERADHAARAPRRRPARLRRRPRAASGARPPPTGTVGAAPAPVPAAGEADSRALLRRLVPAEARVVFALQPLSLYTRKQLSAEEEELFAALDVLQPNRWPQLR